MPGRTQGRTKHDVELVMFATFIVHAIDRGLWEYPIEVLYDDKPDFIIECSKGMIGVEITEQRSKNYGQALAMLQDSDGFMEPSDFKYSENEKKLKGSEVAKLVSKKKLTGKPTMQFSDERKWVKRTRLTVIDKWNKYLNYPNFGGFSRNILVIFDVRPESPYFDDVTDGMKKDLFSLATETGFHELVLIDGHYLTVRLDSEEFILERNNLL